MHIILYSTGLICTLIERNENIQGKIMIKLLLQNIYNYTYHVAKLVR